VILTFISFAAAAGEDEGYKLNTIWRIFANLFYVLRFPTHLLFWQFLIKHASPAIYFAGLFINCLFYGLLIERFFWLRRRKSKLAPVPKER
jgi:hypothetical protein